eukprot:scaffold324484_cov31-Prasinocladus_malaysianus.AAC.1
MRLFVLPVISPHRSGGNAAVRAQAQDRGLEGRPVPPWAARDIPHAAPGPARQLDRSEATAPRPQATQTTLNS